MAQNKTRKNAGKGHGAEERRRRIRQHNDALRVRLRATVGSDSAYESSMILGLMGRGPARRDRFL